MYGSFLLTLGVAQDHSLFKSRGYMKIDSFSTFAKDSRLDPYWKAIECVIWCERDCGAES